MTEKVGEEDNDEEEDDKRQQPDQFLDAFGDFGRWQAFCFALFGLPVVVSTYPTLIMTFMNARLDFWCRRPDHLADVAPDRWRELSGQEMTKGGNCKLFNTTFDDWRLGLIEADRSPSFEAELVGYRPCDAWEYDRTKFTSTISSEFNLVCEDDYLLSINQTIYFSGMLVGVTVAGMLSDRFGRKSILIAVVLLLSVSGIMTGIAPDFHTFLVARMFSALGCVGVLMLCLSYLLEMSGGKWTTIVGVGIEFYWVTAWISLGALAFVLTDWRNLVLATSVPGLLIVAFFWLIPESPKWLYTVGRVEEAEAAVRKIAKFNGKTLPDDWRLEKKIQDKDGGTRATANVFDLFRNPHTCGKTLILYANWFICSLTYYGLTLNSSELGGDFHVNFMINGVLEIPAYGISMIAIGYLGRRIPYALSLALSGVSLLSLMFIPSHLTDLVVAVAILGKFFVTISFGIIYLYTSELFPTELRATGVGTSCFVSRIGGMAAGWVGLLTKYHVYLPTSIYGVSALVIAAMALALPETKGEKMPDTVEEGERMKLLLYPGEIVSGKKRIHSLPV